jgi:hypothetical protein
MRREAALVYDVVVACQAMFGHVVWDDSEATVERIRQRLTGGPR